MLEKLSLQPALEGAQRQFGVRSEGGRLFQVAGPNTAKLRWPVEVRLTAVSSVRSPTVCSRLCYCVNNVFCALHPRENPGYAYVRLSVSRLEGANC